MANIGIAMGSVGSGFIALDIDTRHQGDQSLARLEATLGKLPAAYKAYTGGGGSHILYRLPDGTTIRNKIGLLQGLDIIGDGGYIIVSPSVHHSGNAYRWDTSRHPLTSASTLLPDALGREIERLSAPTPMPAAKTRPRASSTVGASRVDRARAYAETMDPAVQGQSGDRKTFVVCSTVARGFDLTESETMEVLRSWNQRCSPPWCDYQLRRKIRHAIRYGREPVGGRLLV